MKNLKDNLKKVWPYMKPEKYNIIMYFIIGILSIIINILIPIVSAQVIVNITNVKLKQLLLMSIVLFIINNIKNLLQYIETYYDINIYWNSYSRLQNKLNETLLKLENSTIDNKKTGTFIERMSYDTGRITGFLNVLTENIPNVLTSIGILIAILIIDYKTFIIILISIIINALLENKRSDKVIDKDKEYRKLKEKNTSFINEITRGNKDIKMLNSEKMFLKELSNKVNKIKEVNYQKQNIDRKYILLRNFLKDLLTLLLTLYLSYEIYFNKLTIAHALVLLNYSTNIPNLILEFASLLDRVKDFNLSVSRAFSIMDDKLFKKEKFGNKHIDNIEGNFEFKNVTFSYGNDNVLEDINFKINSNETVAFVGKSGSGKSTIFNLLCKMYTVNKGTISVDGIDINELDKDSIRSNITVINQNPYIFNMSLRDNFKMVKENLTENEMIESCKLACLHDFIMTLPNGYDTIIGEGGVNLSGGEKQRVAIARALIQKTKIILFDEATSALDNETQSKIQEAINNMKKDYTIMIIAHRLSTIKNVDRILFINNKKIKAQGTHEELMKECKEYKQLYEKEIIQKESSSK